LKNSICCSGHKTLTFIKSSFPDYISLTMAESRLMNNIFAAMRGQATDLQKTQIAEDTMRAKEQAAKAAAVLATENKKKTLGSTGSSAKSNGKGCGKCWPTGKGSKAFEKFICYFHACGKNGCFKDANECKGLHVAPGSACSCGRKYNIFDMYTKKALCMDCRIVNNDGRVREGMVCAFYFTEKGCSNDKCTYLHIDQVCKGDCDDDGLCECPFTCKSCKREIEMAKKPNE
jgi:hypothetical protein